MEDLMNQTALAYLSQNPLLHMDMVAPIQRGTAEILYAAEDGVCLRETKSGAYMASAASEEAGTRLLELLPREGLFSFHQAHMVDKFNMKARYTTLIENFQAVYLLKEPLPIIGELEIKPLDMGQLELVLEQYDIDVGADYLRGRIAEGTFFGGYADGALVGFAGIHAEGSIGLLKVFDQYRNRGYGTALNSFMVNHQLACGIVPFEQIGVENKASLAVAEKMGFSISTERVYWLF